MLGLDGGRGLLTWSGSDWERGIASVFQITFDFATQKHER